MDRPNLYAAMDYRAFLRDWFDWKKSQSPNFSHRLFAKRAGHRNPSLLLHIIEGTRNLTDATLEGFCRALDLDEQEDTHFRDLVEAEQGGTPEVRRRAQERVLSTRRFHVARPLDALTLDLLQDWVATALHELARTPGFRLGDPRALERRLRFDAPPERLAAALAVLLDAGMIALGSDGGALVRDAALSTDPEVTALAASTYHASTLGLAIDAIREVPQAERTMAAFTVALHPRDLEELKAHLQKLASDFFGRCQGSEPHEVYQFNLAFFPLTREGPKGG